MLLMALKEMKIASDQSQKNNLHFSCFVFMIAAFKIMWSEMRHS